MNKKIRYKINKNTGCWECTSHYCNTHGYPKVIKNGKQVLLHRYSYEKFKGKIPEGMLIMHTCDNRVCFNPNHLVMGTTSDNIKDMWKKDRGLKGEAMDSSKLTENNVRWIRNNSGKITQERMAMMLGVGRSTIQSAVDYKSWKHVV